ncbi:ABC transporter substrate-binding protein [Bacillus benzoevorans]|uniref:Peptide/nickel transport system substrate-binding protein n=1 Tax=Bacillus benzoevorans TaxID=1456 RepID=A0A7X0HSS6_9BACI|nr:ABC transporter substrate-binding protein [Bacillus benzoevorans]MBB6446183.1 peptide/nickel transport system substrate-binding protein [Bacillus benzoevorans]
MKIKNLFISLILCFVLLLSACSTSGTSSSSSGGGEDGGELIIGMESEADILDPHGAGGWVTMRINNQMFEPLIGEDLSRSSEESPVPELIPVLAKSWEVSEDGKTYTFHLREGVKFHDGSDFNAEAVDFNIKRLTDESFEFYDELGAGRTFRTWKFFESSEVVDENTINIHLSSPFSEFPRMLAQTNSLQIVSAEAIKKNGNKAMGENPVGTGPFKFDSRKRGEHITLVRNEDYWGEKAKLDKVIFRPLTDPAARVLAIQNDEVDIIAVPPPDSIENLKEQGFDVVSGTPPHIWYLTFNFDNEYMKNQKVRQAINYAINREGIANELLKGTVNPAYTIQSPGAENYDPERKWYEYDPEKAKQLLKEAGFENGFKTTLQTSVGGSGQLLPVDIAEWIQRDLKKVGIEVALDTQEWITYYSGYSDGMTPDVGMNQMSSGRTSPYFLSMVSHSEFVAPGGFNSGKYVNTELDAVLDKASTSVDKKEALELWKQAEAIIMEDAAFAPILNDSAPYVVNSRVKGFVVPSEEWYTLAPVYIEE